MGARRKPLLLLADDDPTVRAVLSGLFAQDAEIIEAVNGRQALELIEYHRPDLVILDDIMPPMTGLKLLETLRANRELAFIPVVMLTSSDRPKDVMRGLMGGATDYITKPFHPDRFAHMIRARLKWQMNAVLPPEPDVSYRDSLFKKCIRKLLYGK